MPTWWSLENIPKVQLPGWLTHGGADCSRRAWKNMEAQSLFPHTLPYSSLSTGYSPASFIIFFCNKLVNSTLFYSVLWASFSKELKLEDGRWWLPPNVSEAQVKWHLKWVGQSCGTESLTCGIWRYIYENWVNCSTPSWYCREMFPTPLVSEALWVW